MIDRTSKRGKWLVPCHRAVTYSIQVVLFSGLLDTVLAYCAGKRLLCLKKWIVLEKKMFTPCVPTLKSMWDCLYMLQIYLSRDHLPSLDSHTNVTGFDASSKREKK